MGNIFTYLGQVTIAIMAGLATISRITPPVLGVIQSISVSAPSLKVDLKLKHVMPNGVTVYSDQHATSKIISVVDEFPEI